MNNTHRLKEKKNLIKISRNHHIGTNFIYPIFVSESHNDKEALPGIPYYSIDGALSVCEKACEHGIPGVMIFDLLDDKNDTGSAILDEKCFTAKLYGEIKRNFHNDLLIFSDAAMCSYRNNGLCVYHRNSRVLLNETNEMIAKIAVAQAEYGADVVVLAEMADGQVGKTRKALDSSDLDNIPILSLIKSDSCLFDPYAKAMGKRGEPEIPSHTYRTDPLNFNSFKNKINIEIDDGVDMLSIKPALPNLDIIRYAKDNFSVSVGAFQVSGEYIMIRSIGEQGYVDKDKLLLESISSMIRAGADFIFTYYALELCELQK